MERMIRVVDSKKRKSTSPRGIAARRRFLRGEIENEGVRGGR